ncbi:MAG TPA: hypothetical protein VLH56_11770 [Dissulfurispiraceae bacterium]|nr:hypothetical protein [Dissulfurispiraceae bacterium]
MKTPKELAAENAELREALEGMLHQFAYFDDGAFHTGGLSALEDGFAALGWGERHESPESCCQAAGCRKRATCGTPTATGEYRLLCGKHDREARHKQPRLKGTK